MSILEKQVDALMRLCVAEKEDDRNRVREEVRRMLENRKAAHCIDPEYLIRKLLLDLGAPDHLSGHPFVIQAVLLVLQDRTYINSITFSLYPHLALMFDTTPPRVERAIRHLIEATWTRGNLEMLDRYFGSAVSANRGKPTNGEFIARMASLVRQRLTEAA